MTVSPGSMARQAKKPTRRGKSRPTRPRSEVCRRKACGRPVEMPDRAFCSGLCRLVTRQQERAQRVSEALQGTPLATSLVAQAEAMGTAWSEYQRLDQELNDAARAVGMTDAQLEAIQHGRG